MPAGDINVSLPFRILRDDGTNEKGLFRLGRYNSWTLVTFSTVNNVWPQSVDFIPEVDRSTEAYNASQSGGSTIYLISEGQVRRFRYRYPTAYSSKSFASIPQTFQSQSRNPDAIALALPKGAHEFAVAKGRLSIPPRLVTDEPAFPATTTDPNQQFLEVAYEVPATSFQRAVVKWGVKGLGAILPIAGLFFLSQEQIRNQRLRRGLIGGGISLFAIILAVIVWVATTTSDSGDLIGDLLLLLSSAGISVLIYRFRVQEQPKFGHPG